MSDVNSPTLLPARMDFASAIGNFLINFGALDYLILDYVKGNLDSAEFARFKEKPFKARVNRVTQHFRDSNRSTEVFENLLTRLEPVRELRNHIAHGHLLCRLDIDTKQWMASISLPKDLDLAYSAETRHLTFDELRRHLNELTELVEAFDRQLNSA